MTWRAVTDKQWALIEAPLPPRQRRTPGGQPPAAARLGFEGSLWGLWTGAPWRESPAQYGAKRPVPRRLPAWAASDVLWQLWRAFVDPLDDRQKVRWDACSMDGMFIPAQKGGCWSGRRQEAREPSAWYRPMARVLRSEYTCSRLPPRRSLSWSRR
jgi:transposase